MTMGFEYTLMPYDYESWSKEGVEFQCFSQKGIGPISGCGVRYALIR